MPRDTYLDVGCRAAFNLCRPERHLHQARDIVASILLPLPCMVQFTAVDVPWPWRWAGPLRARPWPWPLGAFSRDLPATAV